MKTLRSLLMAVALMALMAVPAFAQDDEPDCDDYESQAAAQAAYNADTSDPYGLDGPPGEAFAGVEGVACEGNPGPYSCEYRDDCEEPLVIEPKTPKNQQSDDTITKTFELTLNGDVPADRGFAVFYGTRDQFEGLFESESEEQPFDYILFCGQPEDAEFADTVVSDEDCVGDGTKYRAEVELPHGTELFFSYATAVETDLDTADFFFGNVGTLFETGELSGEPEVLDTDFTNTAWFTFGGAGDDKQDDTQDDAQDDQQGEMPGEMPDTGAGGLAAGATIPVGNAVAGLTMLVGAGYATVRRR